MQHTEEMHKIKHEETEIGTKAEKTCTEGEKKCRKEPSEEDEWEQ